MTGRRRTDIAGLILAGGRSRRMGGGDKALLTLGGVTLLTRVAATLAPQVGPLLLSAASDAVRGAAPGLPAVTDPLPDFAGPLAGVLAGLDWVRAKAPQCHWLISVPVDAPLLPADLVVRLAAAVEAGAGTLACARSGGRRHPVVCLWPLALAETLAEAVLVEGVRRVAEWLGRHRLALVDWPDQPLDPFLNVNTPEDFARLAAALAKADPGGTPGRRRG
ncbi:MAG: molybdenum cofactor guanylyltransferase MobA [Rhodospirillaceae bacterium]